MSMLPSRLRIRLISPGALLVWSGCISEPDPSARSPLNNQTINGINISSTIVGDNTTYVMDDLSRHRVTTYLGTPSDVSGQPTDPSYSVLPIVLSASHSFPLQV